MWFLENLELLFYIVIKPDLTTDNAMLSASKAKVNE